MVKSPGYLRASFLVCNRTGFVSLRRCRGLPSLVNGGKQVSAMWITSVIGLGKLFKVKQVEAEQTAANEHR